MTSCPLSCSERTTVYQAVYVLKLEKLISLLDVSVKKCVRVFSYLFSVGVIYHYFVVGILGGDSIEDNG